MPRIEVNGVSINTVQMSCDSGRECQDLVMVHGLATNLAFWYFTHAEAFSKRYRVTLYDLRGHGLSSMTESGYSAKNMAIDLRQLLDRLGIAKAHFIAHSYGGAIALSLAFQDPNRFSSLTLVDTHISAIRRLHNNDWKHEEKIKQILEQNNIRLDVKDPHFGHSLLTETSRLKVRGAKVTKELDDMLYPLMGKNSTRSANQWLRLIDTTQAEKEFSADDGLSLDGLRKLTFPILAMYGERSQAMTTGERLLDVWPHADFRRIRESGHFFPITRPVDFRDACLYFLQNGLVKDIPHRRFDFERKYFRANRFYSRSGKWFFDTREAKENGPFNDIEEAKRYLRSNPFFAARRGNAHYLDRKGASNRFSDGISNSQPAGVR